VPTDPGRLRHAGLDETVFTFLNVMRYGFPATLLCAAVILLLGDPHGNRIGGFAMLVAGSALSFVILGVVYRLSVSSEVERDEEDAARAYLCAHGQWPDETPEQVDA
jgi:hypothetical protein